MKRKLRIAGKLVTKSQPEPEKPIEWEYKVRTILGFEVMVENPNHGRDTRDHFIDIVGNDEIEFTLWRRPVGDHELRHAWQPMSFNVDIEERSSLSDVVFDLETHPHSPAVRPYGYPAFLIDQHGTITPVDRDNNQVPVVPISLAYTVVARGVETVFAYLSDAIDFANRFTGYTLPPRPRGSAQEVYRVYGDDFSFLQWSTPPVNTQSRVYRVLTEVPAFSG